MSSIDVRFDAFTRDSQTRASVCRFQSTGKILSWVYLVWGSLSLLWSPTKHGKTLTPTAFPLSIKISFTCDRIKIFPPRAQIGLDWFPNSACFLIGWHHLCLDLIGWERHLVSINSQTRLSKCFRHSIRAASWIITTIHVVSPKCRVYPQGRVTWLCCICQKQIIQNWFQLRIWRYWV